MNYKKYIREIIDFPQKWINFKDITPLLQNPEIFKKIIDDFSENIKWVDVIVWLDARWFIFGWALAYKLNKPFVIVRKNWKLPYETVSVEYELEYWKNIFELHTDSIKKWDTVAIIDDLLATWWTAKAACELVEKLWWKIDSLNFVINLSFLPWEKILKDYKINSLVNY
jgi:adenine phosphoribosyltransferase